MQTEITSQELTVTPAAQGAGELWHTLSKCELWQERQTQWISTRRDSIGGLCSIIMSISVGKCRIAHALYRNMRGLDVDGGGRELESVSRETVNFRPAEWPLCCV